MNDFFTQISQAVDSSRQNLGLALGLVAIFWGVFLLNLISGQRLNQLGIVPRTERGLIGIVFSPFLHANFQHLLFNSIPLFLLIDLVLLQSVSTFCLASIGIIFISGMAVWLIGRRAVHIGASGLIMGYWGFLLFEAYLKPSAMTLFVVIVCLYYFGGLFFQIVPRDKSISWEGHLFGVLSGLFMAWLLSKGVY